MKILKCSNSILHIHSVEYSWNVMAHGGAREGKWRGNLRMDWVASTLHTTSELDVSSITTADAHNSAASSRLNWRPCRFKKTRPFRREAKSGFCACAITFQTQSTSTVPQTTILHNSQPPLFHIYSRLYFLGCAHIWNQLCVVICVIVF